MSETKAPISLIEHFSDCKDPRRDLGKDHLLIDIRRDRNSGRHLRS